MTCSVQVSFLNPTLLGLTEVYQSRAENDILERSHPGGLLAPDGGTSFFDATIDLCARYASRGLYEPANREASAQSCAPRERLSGPCTGRRPSRAVLRQPRSQWAHGRPTFHDATALGTVPYRGSVLRQPSWPRLAGPCYRALDGIGFGCHRESGCGHPSRCERRFRREFLASP